MCAIFFESKFYLLSTTNLLMLHKSYKSIGIYEAVWFDGHPWFGVLTEQEPVSQFRFFSLKRIQTIVAFSEHTAYLPWLLRNSSYARNFNFPCITFLSVSLFQNLHLPFLPSPGLKPPRSPCSFLNLLSRFFSLSPSLPPSLLSLSLSIDI